jgi:hypothetical protein
MHMQDQETIIPPLLSTGRRWYAKDVMGEVTDVQRNTGNPFEKAVGPGFIGSTCFFPSITRHVSSPQVRSSLTQQRRLGRFHPARP